MAGALEGILMRKCGIEKTEARRLAKKGRKALNLDGVDWSKALEKECIRILKEEQDKVEAEKEQRRIDIDSFKFEIKVIKRDLPGQDGKYEPIESAIHKKAVEECQQRTSKSNAVEHALKTQHVNDDKVKQEEDEVKIVRAASVKSLDETINLHNGEAAHLRKTSSFDETSEHFRKKDRNRKHKKEITKKSPRKYSADMDGRDYLIVSVLENALQPVPSSSRHSDPLQGESRSNSLDMESTHSFGSSESYRSCPSQISWELEDENDTAWSVDDDGFNCKSNAVWTAPEEEDYDAKSIIRGLSRRYQTVNSVLGTRPGIPFDHAQTSTHDKSKLHQHCYLPTSLEPGKFKDGQKPVLTTKTYKQTKRIDRRFDSDHNSQLILPGSNSRHTLDGTEAIRDTGAPKLPQRKRASSEEHFSVASIANAPINNRVLKPLIRTSSYTQGRSRPHPSSPKRSVSFSDLTEVKFI